jgi:hypothetical protein
MKLVNKYKNKTQKKKILQYCNTAILRATLLPAALLSGCMGIYEGGFECPAGTGVGCKSISEVNQMVNQGELPKGGLPKIEVEPPTPRNHEIWYAPRASHQWSVISNQKKSSVDSDNNSLPLKEDRKKVDLSDV